MRHLRLILLAAVAAVVVGLVPAAAHAAVINFDDLVTGGPGGAGAPVTVNAQYAGMGVTFNDLTAFDYSKGAFAIPNFAHSGTIGVEDCYTAEQCTTPLAANFTVGQTSVGAWVGLSFANTGGPLTIVLTALDAQSHVVGTDMVTLPTSNSPTPIQHHLQFVAGSAVIRRLEISFANPFNNSGLAVDDVEFSTAGPPPPCSATAVPTVNLAQPAHDQQLQINEFILQGAVTTNGAPLTDATITSVGSPSTTSELFPRLIGDNGGSFGPVRFDGLLSRGKDLIILKATNCFGTGQSQPIQIEYTPIAAAARLKLLDIEVTQTIQDSSNSVTLIASNANGTKRTFARAYFGLTGASAEITGIRGVLTATRPDGSPPGGPLSVTSVNALSIANGATISSARSQLGDSLNFELPPQWLTAGKLHLSVSQLSIDGETSNVPCDNCDNHEAVGPSAAETFHAVPPVRLHIVSVPYTIPGDATVHTPTQNDIDHLSSWLRRAYPTADVEITQETLQVRSGAPTSCDTINSDLVDFEGSVATDNPDVHFYGLVSDNAGKNFMRGCSVIGGQFGSGPAGSGSFGWDNDGSYADWYGGHELGHQYGRLHPGDCNGNSDDDHNFPFLGGAIGNSFFDYLGFDPGDATLGIVSSVMDWRAGWADVMTYCNNEWMSAYTYEGILANLCARDLAECPDAVALGASARRVPVAGRVAANRISRTAIGLQVIGTLRIATGKLSLSPLTTIPHASLTPRPHASAYAVVLRNARGRQLARYPFTVAMESDAPSTAKAVALVHVVVPFKSATRRVLVVTGKRILASAIVAAHAPKVHLVAPNGGQKLGSRVKVVWSSHDTNRKHHTYDVYYIPDGKRLIPVASAVRGTSVTVDLTGLAGGAHARFRVIASEGARTGTDSSDRTFSVPVKAPRVAIVAPATGASITAGDTITLLGSALDPQSGQLVGTHLTWSSSLQGVIGQGSSITVTLNPGIHVITLTATDGSNRAASASITVTVAGVPPLLNRAG